MAMAIEWAENNAPNMKTIEIQGSAYHDGGASATQETAYAMSAAIAYIRAMGRRGIDAARTIRQITFRFSLGTNFFMEIARRARRMDSDSGGFRRGRRGMRRDTRIRAHVQIY